jgi:FkbM family methyltransferase
MIKYFMENWEKCKSEETFEKIKQVKEILEDEEPKKVLETRIEVYETGDVSLLKSIYSNSAQYFNQDLLALSDNEIFIDLGAYKGDTIEAFISSVKGKYKKIIAFEPDQENMLCLNRYILENNIENVVVYKLASWNKKGILRFHEDGSYISQVSDKGTSSTYADSVDNVLFNITPVTLIKMDIEGAELKTIEGAESIIKRYKPKLAICVYHRADDIYEIPLAIKKLVPEYKLYLRQHSDSLLDTVLYATI